MSGDWVVYADVVDPKAYEAALAEAGDDGRLAAAEPRCVVIGRFGEKEAKRRAAETPVLPGVAYRAGRCDQP